MAKDKPIALGEVGAVPPLDTLRNQPRWTWFMVWDEGSGGLQGFQEFCAAYDSEETLTHDELPWVTNKEPKVHYPVLK